MDGLKNNRRSIRLPGYDYSQSGYYSVTICVYGKKQLFGKIQKNFRGTKFCVLNDYGDFARKCWQEIPEHFPNVELDEYQIMPNHVHGIIQIKNEYVGDADLRPLHYDRSKMLLSKIVHGYKSTVTRKIRKKSQNKIKIWQRSFYEHVIRDDRDLKRIREYVITNPDNWDKDEYNMSAISNSLDGF